ncbi:MAG: glycosyltransferase, partial [Pseudomonadota bacterium]
GFGRPIFMTKNELILLPILKANRGAGGGYVLTRKYLEGAREYARTWPGPVTTLAEFTATRSTDLDHVEVHPADLDTGLETRPATQAALAARIGDAAVALAYLCREEEPTARLCAELGVPLVFTSEYSHETERQIIDATVRNPLVRVRRRYWMWNAQRSCRRSLALAAGLQCSGTPTYEAFRDLQPEALLFFDNRVRAEDVIPEAALEGKLAGLRAGRALRLVFGGRLIAMKGVMDLPKIAQRLKALEVPFSLEIYGSGPLEDALRQSVEALGLVDEVALKGALDFRTGWIAALKDRADLFLCCHPQGDPSSTYPEVMSCGVPIAGYANAAFRGIVAQSGSGFLTPLKSPAALAAEVARLHNARDELVQAAHAARDFALAHTFEKTFRRRTEHLIAASRL